MSRVRSGSWIFGRQSSGKRRFSDLPIDARGTGTARRASDRKTRSSVAHPSHIGKFKFRVVGRRDVHGQNPGYFYPRDDDRNDETRKRVRARPGGDRRATATTTRVADVGADGLRLILSMSQNLISPTLKTGKWPTGGLVGFGERVMVSASSQRSR